MTLTNVPYAWLPGAVRARVGIGYAFDDASRGPVRAHVALTARP